MRTRTSVTDPHPQLRMFLSFLSRMASRGSRVCCQTDCCVIYQSELSEQRIELTVESDARMSGFDEILGPDIGNPSIRHKCETNVSRVSSSRLLRERGRGKPVGR